MNAYQPPSLSMLILPPPPLAQQDCLIEYVYTTYRCNAFVLSLPP